MRKTEDDIQKKTLFPESFENISVLYNKFVSLQQRLTNANDS